jgi:hypothetical protein
MPAAVLPYLFLTATRSSDSDPVVCQACGSLNIVPFEWHGPTGVVAPDGGCEYRTQVGYKCRNCGAIEEL